MTDRRAFRQYWQRLHDSFPFFLAEIWRLRRVPVPCRIQIDIAKWLQHGPKRRGIRGFRGLSKTWITCAYICWRLFRDQNEKILLASMSQPHSVKSAYMIRAWIDEIPFLRHLAPESSQRDTMTDGFDVKGCEKTRVHSVTPVGITSQLPGGRASLVIPDDVEGIENTVTKQQRDRLRERAQEFDMILYPKGDIVYLGNPFHPESLYDDLEKPPRDRDYKPYIFRSWPIQYPAADEPTPSLSPMLREDLDSGRAQPGDPIWPERFGKDYLLNLNVGRTRFLMQYMLIANAGAEERHPLKLADLIIYPVHRTIAPTTIAWGMSNNRGSTAIEALSSPGLGSDQFYAPIFVNDVFLPYRGCKAYLDPAGTGADETAWAIIGQLHGYLHVKYVNGVKHGATTENLEKIVLSLRNNHCNELHVETNFGQDAYLRLIETVIARFSLSPNPKSEEFPDGWSCAVIGSPSTGQKEQRIIDGIEPVMNQHRLIVDPTIAADNKLMYQLTRITMERNCLEHDDRIEVVAGCVELFSDILNQDAQHQEDLRKAEEQDEALQKYYAEMYETPPPDKKKWVKV